MYASTLGKVLEQHSVTPPPWLARPAHRHGRSASGAFASCTDGTACTGGTGDARLTSPMRPPCGLLSAPTGGVQTASTRGKVPTRHSVISMKALHGNPPARPSLRSRVCNVQGTCSRLGCRVGGVTYATIPNQSTKRHKEDSVLLEARKFPCLPVSKLNGWERNDRWSAGRRTQARQGDAEEGAPRVGQE